MGKGDKKTRRGKITMGTYGVSRPRKKTKPFVVVKKKKQQPLSKLLLISLKQQPKLNQKQQPKQNQKQQPKQNQKQRPSLKLLQNLNQKLQLKRKLPQKSSRLSNKC